MSVHTHFIGFAGWEIDSPQSSAYAEELHIQEPHIHIRNPKDVLEFVSEF
jgi:hypothetical protein